jgi:divalent metal cation (Fe/Co/Zn/Cd) transporter
MDRQDSEDVRLLKSLLDAHLGPSATEPRICAYHKLRHRHSGRYHWVDFHIQVPSAWTIQYAHEVAGAIEGEMERALGEGNATAHIEPCTAADCPWCTRPNR